MSDGRNPRDALRLHFWGEPIQPNVSMLADEVLAALELEGFRVVPRDAVVINRDDIPEGLIETLSNLRDDLEAEAPDAPFASAVRAALRLLSGGSPAAPEGGEPR